ncbi:MAG: excinuclease ABC subunit UvrA [Gemmatimonadota bacterium]
MKDRITIRNARQHNLKGIDLDLPRRSLVVLTGPSGSGKSSLAFDTLYAEGQRRYVESLSTYAKQFLERMEKPAVDMVDGISPAVAIEQKNPTRTSRSTVGTATETYDYLRLLWARAGQTYCPVCARQVKPDTVQSVADEVLKLEAGTRIMVAFPLPRSARISHERVVENLRALGFIRVLAAGDVVNLDDPGANDPKRLGHDLAGTEELLVIVDRLVIGAEITERLADSVGMAFKEGEGEVVIISQSQSLSLLKYSEFARCEDHPDIKFLEPTPRLFSFNNPYGSCQVCTGFGATLEYDVTCIVPNVERSLQDGAVDPWEKPRYKRARAKLLNYAKKNGIDIDQPWRKLPKAFRDEIIRGTKGFEGVIPFLESKEEKRYKQYIRVFLRRYQKARACHACNGTKLRPEALYVKVNGKTIADMSLVSIAELKEWLDQQSSSQSLAPSQKSIAEPILSELDARLAFLLDVGLNYLTLHRQTRTLSGGEAQRISLANSLGSKLVDTLYVLDEPTIGLHPRDTDRLLEILERLRDGGNSVVVVEHDPAAIAAADHIVELGPGSGEKGGRVVFEGTYEELREADTSTGKNLRSASAAVSVSGGAKFKQRLRLYGARLHNLTGVDIEIPLGTLTAVTGVSGSGKSTLVHDVLFRALEKELSDGESTAKQHLGELIGSYDRIEGLNRIDAAVLVDQSPIGKTPRSNPVTYIKAFEQIRDIFASQPLARQRKYTAGHFSFNVKGGRCEACQGDGVVEIEMVFLADVYVACEICGGARYKPETLEITYKGLNIRQVLDLTIDEAIRFFIKEDKLGQMLWQLQQVGLGYLRLGQPAPTLSGGEAQRLKIARELIHATRKRGHRIYILDEPTTGLSLGEVRKLLEVIRRLTAAGHTAIVIEHNLEIIQAADWVIDLGPEGGSGGGLVVATGTPRDVAKVKESHTGRYLREAFQADSLTV